VDALMSLVRAFCGGRPVMDDVTLVLVEREGEAAVRSAVPSDTD
jgi:hypothetical protein